MSEEPAPTADRADRRSEPERSEAPRTPFDHPLFLPVILLGLSLWCLWDGFIVPLEDHLAFNRWGFALLATATAWFGYKGIQEMRETRARNESAPNRAEDDSPID